MNFQRGVLSNGTLRTNGLTATSKTMNKSTFMFQNVCRSNPEEL